MKSFIDYLRKITKLTYKIRGISRIGNLIRKAYCQSNKVILINDFDKNLSFYCDLNEHMGSYIFWRGFYSEGQIYLLERLLKQDMIFIDVGANHGEFTLFAAKRLTQGLVIAFEPVSFIFKKLKRNVELNDLSNVILIPKGLGYTNQKTTLYGTEKHHIDGSKNEGLYSTKLINDRSTIYEEVEIIRLDDFLKSLEISKVDIIKIDVEGSELDVLMGARNSIKKFKPLIILEVCELTSSAAGYCSSQLLDYLDEMGYEFKLIMRHGKTCPITVEKLSSFQNIICLPKH